jgi:hypothetical protein
MSTRQKNITTLKPIKNKILDLETKRLVNYISITTKIFKDKIYQCWWCTLPIDTNPIGCPYSLKITTNSDDENDIETETVTYYTDGLFCCFNCVKAFIMEHGENDAKYKDSTRLLAMMVYDYERECHFKSGQKTRFCSEPITITPSPPWRFLSQYGGHVTSQQYREMIDRMIYKEKGIVQLQPIVTLYEEEEKFFETEDNGEENEYINEDDVNIKLDTALN